MLVQTLRDTSAADLETAGGKGANLGELVRAGFPVPDGFIVTTQAYVDAARAANVDPDDPRQSAERLAAADLPQNVATAVRQAYAALGGGPVAVRSSATAEDLPGASFAGQQDTYLNVEGEAAVLDAVRRCWASLWNERAVAYRNANTIAQSGVSLAVVVQKMVDASAAGVLFTADPLTGRRLRAAIDAIPELGERLVSGAVDPDHYVVDTPSGSILQRQPVQSQPVLSDAELRELATLGDRVERHFGIPQDIEFALDQHRVVWLVQSRPITTLYPLPAHLPELQRDLRVYVSVSVFQGYFEPFTPMGMQFYHLLGTAVSGAFGVRVADPIGGPEVVVEAGMRLYADVTSVVRDRLGRRLLVTLMGVGESRTSAVIARLASDRRLDVTTTSRVATIRGIVRGFGHAGVPGAALRVFLRPKATRARYFRELEHMARIDLPAQPDAAARLDAFERLMLNAPRLMVPRLLGIIAPAMLSLGLVTALLRGRARPDEIQTVTRGAPFNPTTEMDLALWALSVTLRGDADSRAALLDRTPPDLAVDYLRGALPAQLQSGLAEFLAQYGFRAIGEIDMGVKRWSEDPSHILGALSNYIRLDYDALAPDAQFARGAQEAEVMVRSLIRRVHGPRRVLVRFLLGRVRLLIGAREAPKFQIIRLLVSPSRGLLQPVGAELAEHARIADADDIFFLTLPEARRAVAGEDMREVVAARRREFAREQLRRHLPRVLLSDGTDAEVALVSPGDASAGLRGSPASPGQVTGVARVIQSPVGARLEPGEILVAPSTDPGWTPLFLTAGGLVMEMGGMMSHGAVVAREYGIPAVVGVAGATDRIVTGQQVTVDGSAGTITVH